MRVTNLAKLSMSLAILAVVLVGWSIPQLAAQPTADKQKAKQHYISAEKAMKKQEYALAAREYAEAYSIMKDPVLFYKIGVANQKAGDCSTALVYFGRYLKEGKPSGTFKKLTEEHVAICSKGTSTAGTGTTGTGTTGTGTTGTGTTGTGTTGTTGTGTTGTGTTGTGTTGTGTTGTTGSTEPATGTTTTTTTTTTSSTSGTLPAFSDGTRTWKHSAAWVSVGLTVALLSTGAVLGLSASSREQDIENLYADASGGARPFEGTIKERYDELVDEGDRLNGYSKVSFIAAGVTAASALLFFVLDLTGGKAEAKGSARRGVVTPVVSRNGLGFAAGWEF